MAPCDVLRIWDEEHPPIWHQVPFTKLTIHGKDFSDVPSLEWLADAVKEKIEREKRDENGLVRCGCGGKAQHEDFEDIFFKLSRVSCQRCGIVITTGRGKAKDAWNKAMGGD